MTARTAMRFWTACGLALILCAYASVAADQGQQAPVTAKIELVPANEAKPASRGSGGTATDASNVAVWLSPVDENGTPRTAGLAPSMPPAQLVQRNKTFEPHVLLVEAGTLIQFPNKDPFFHNVFSLYDGKRFDLGLYEAGTTRWVRFSRAGVSFLFCNIHPEMSAVIIAVDTPYFALSDAKGHVAISNVPDGRYEMHVWYERSLVEKLKILDRVVAISPTTRALGTIQVTDNRDFKSTHENKYGQDYVPPAANAY